MIEREYEELMQDVLEGLATPGQVARLEAYLSRNEAGLTRRRELEAVFRTLGRARVVDAPADLRDRVLEALQGRAVSRAPAGDRSLFRGPRARLAYVFAAGLVAGVIAYGALTDVWTLRGSGREPAVTGSMMPPRPAVPAGGAVRRTWSTASTRVDAVSWRVRSSRVAAFQVRGAEEVRIELEFDSRLLSPIGVRQSPAGSGRVVLEPGRVVIEGRDRDEFTLEFDQTADADLPLRVTIRAGGATTRGELPAGGISAGR